jgi:tRNA splicing ligase
MVVYKKLYGTIIEFRELSSWDWMRNEDITGIDVEKEMKKYLKELGV